MTDAKKKKIVIFRDKTVAFAKKYSMTLAIAGCALVVGLTWLLTYDKLWDRNPAPGASVDGEQQSGNDLSQGLDEALRTLQPGAVTPSASPTLSPSPTPTAAGVKQPTAVVPNIGKPADGNVVKSYAMDTLVYNKTLKQWATHSGIDIEVAAEDDVLVALDGKIDKIYKDSFLGNCVLIKNNDRISMLYAGLLSLEGLEEGKSVKKGDVLGLCGGAVPCELEDPTHLHFELWLDNAPINPVPYIK